MTSVVLNSDNFIGDLCKILQTRQPSKENFLEPNDPRRLAAGKTVDQNIKHLEKRLGVSIHTVTASHGMPMPCRQSDCISYRETVDKDAIEPDLHLFLQQAGLNLVAWTKSADEQGPPVVMMSDADRRAEANSESSADASAEAVS